MNHLDKLTITTKLAWYKTLEKLAALSGNDISRQEASCRYWALNNLARQKDGHLESASGPGSTLIDTDQMRTFLEDCILKYSISTITDIGCGDWNWMSEVDFHGTRYLGLDVVTHTVSNNIKKYGHRDGVEFRVFNAITDLPPKSDLVIIRDVLFHLSNEHGAQVLNNVRKSESQFLLTTTFPSEVENRSLGGYDNNLKGWGFHRINVELPPYNLSGPVASIAESKHEREQRLYEL